MSDPRRCVAAADVQLSELFRLAAPLIVHLEDSSAVSPTAADARRPAGERGGRRRGSLAAAAAVGRPPGSGARRNERERNRVRQVNAGFDRLRDHVPQGRRNRKLSKVDTLRAAVDYIGQLQAMLGHPDDSPPIADENYLDPAGSVGGDVIGSWYLDRRAPVDSSSLMQLLVGADDVTRALQGAGSGSSTVTVDRRLTLDVSHVTCDHVTCSTSDRSSTAGSGSYGACATPESVDHEVTSSSDDAADELVDLGLWFS